MAQYDLTPKLAIYLDRHLTIPLLEFLKDENVHPANEVEEQRLLLLSKTAMIDSYRALYKQLKGAEPPAEVVARRKEIMEKMTTLAKEVEIFIKTFLSEGQSELWKQLRDQGNFNLEYLQRNHSITEHTLESMHKYAKAQFEAGRYSVAAEFLYFYRLLTATREHDVSAMWGKLASEMLTKSWDAALDDFRLLRESLDSTMQTPVQSRLWFIHWGLYLFSFRDDGWDILQDLFFDVRSENDVRTTPYLGALQTAAPYLVRYLTVACVINRKKRPRLMKELERIIEQESPSYRDPITEFVEQLCLNCDFEAAQQKLKECEAILNADFFLYKHASAFLENARLLLFENYCRIHSVIDIAMVAEKLGMDRAQAEIWLVNLIRQARLDARIDSQMNRVLMDMHAPDVYQNIKEKTKSLPGRTAYLWRTANPNGTIVADDARP